MDAKSLVVKESQSFFKLMGFVVIVFVLHKTTEYNKAIF